MPEGPETHALADRLSMLLVDETLSHVHFIDPALQQRRGLLEGQRVLAVEARGKALLTAVAGGWTLYAHSHLFGFWRFVDDQDALPDGAPPRLVLATVRGVAALYAAPSISLWRTDALGAQPYLAKLGPDVLDAAVDGRALLAHMRTPRFARRTLAVLLLDQGFAAGMGNYLRSEVLFQAKLSPHRLLADLATGERRRLANALLDVPRRAYRAKHDDALPPGKDYLARTRAQFGFEVFERKGDPCPRGDGRIVEDRLAGRRLYWCPGCQQ
ncbi:DNA-formamidopyrimidine glycosylase family protein [Luteimonas sp. 3794]|uniref:DNA-formamidopyrimidine glycosylase family protein n=1 Tax=Luteimonas sp. 3794 TaxID=2817730 RepID=UPI002861980E|nr:DNA-formamidopyrimidine glycosylase family protein [Luteimonas sp. 3794]MDR6992551.1 endonuclease-8 [Luteimonas sp. 3794]